jgi:transposase
MSHSLLIAVSESVLELQTRHSKSGAALRPRIKMLICLAKGIAATDQLATKTGVSGNTIRLWKHKYAKGGIEELLREGRGGDRRSGLSAEQKEAIAQKVSSPADALRSYKEAQTWLSDKLGIEKNYHALNKYLKRNFNTKLKVGRKSHVKKDEAAMAVFKKPA